MTDKILVVTAPDDVTISGVRILAVDLTQEQGQIISNALLQLDNLNTNIINYVWNLNNDISWLLDKKLKCDIIIFNADSSNNTIVGYLSASSKSYYFGTLKDLHLVNNRAIYTSKEVQLLLEKILKQHDEI
jgi:hypothetical protein